MASDPTDPVGLVDAKKLTTHTFTTRLLSLKFCGLFCIVRLKRVLFNLLCVFFGADGQPCFRFLLNSMIRVTLRLTLACGQYTFFFRYQEARILLLLNILLDGEKKVLISFTIPHEVDYPDADSAALGQTPRSGRD